MTLNFPPLKFPAKRLRFFITLPSQREVAARNRDEEVSFIPMAAISETGHIDLSEVKSLGQAENGYTYFRNGDVVIAKITPCFENGKGALAKNLVSGIGFGTTELFVLRPSDDVDPRFLYYFTASKYFRDIGTGMMYGAGGQKRIPASLVLDIPFPSIDRADQRGLADFLDHETSDTDALIEKYESLLDLLEEKRRAFITSAVTRGLDPGVMVKGTERPWIGDIPVHWQVRPLRHIAKRIETGGTPPDSSFSDDGLPWYKPGDFNLQIDMPSAEKSVREDAPVRRFPKGAVLVVGIGATLGKVGLPPSDFTSNQQCNAITPADGVNSRFLAYALMASYDEMRSRASTSTLAILNQAKMKQLEIAMPEAPEQEQIVEALDCFVEDNLRLIKDVQQATVLAKERRAALITAVVTGDMDISAYKHGEAGGSS